MTTLFQNATIYYIFPLSEVVKVTWDIGTINVYRHGAESAYDLKVVDEPRELSTTESIKIGVKVRRGMYQFCVPININM